MKEYLIYLAQQFPNFRKAELESLADLNGFSVDLSHHDEANPFVIVKLENDTQARQLVERSLLSRGIYELWGQGRTLAEMHQDIKHRSNDKFALYKDNSFKFDIIGYKGKREKPEQVAIIETFDYLGFDGPIRLKNPDVIFTVLEEYQVEGMEAATTPERMWFGREIQLSLRTKGILDKYDLRRRKYIGTTSFDAELSLISCNIGQVEPGKFMYDPFTGTGSFLVAAANFGAITIGSDIDMRILQGKGQNTIKSNFKQYDTSLCYIDAFQMDFTHNAFRKDLVIDSIVCDPPYGVREGLKVCGAKNEIKSAGRESVIIDGEVAHLRRDYIQPKKPYSLAALLDDLLRFSAERLPVGGRLAFWMPTANDDYEENKIPQNERLELLYNLKQDFNKWSRILLVYVKRDETYQGVTSNGLVDNKKSFRERYFGGFN